MAPLIAEEQMLHALKAAQQQSDNYQDSARIDDGYACSAGALGGWRVVHLDTIPVGNEVGRGCRGHALTMQLQCSKPRITLAQGQKDHSYHHAFTCNKGQVPRACKSSCVLVPPHSLSAIALMASLALHA